MRAFFQFLVCLDQRNQHSFFWRASSRSERRNMFIDWAVYSHRHKIQYQRRIQQTSTFIPLFEFHERSALISEPFVQVMCSEVCVVHGLDIASRISILFAHTLAPVPAFCMALNRCDEMKTEWTKRKRTSNTLYRATETKNNYKISG